MATVGPAHIDIVPWGIWKASSYTPARGQNSSALMGGHITGTTLQNGYVTYDVPLIAGNWSITYIGRTDSTAGIVTLSIDGVDISPTYDAYSAGTVYNVVQQWTGVVVAASGVKEIKIRCATKNASSSAYNLRPGLITFSSEDDPTSTFSVAPTSVPDRFDIVPFGFWEYGVNVGSRANLADSLMGGYVSGTQTTELGWDIPLSAGTWELKTLHRNRTSAAIQTWLLDATTLGTIDQYAASDSSNNVGSITGIVVATSKYYRLKLTTATKNASSSNYVTNLQHITLRKTA